MEFKNDFGVKALEMAERLGELSVENKQLLSENTALLEKQKKLEVIVDNLHVVGDDYVTIKDAEVVVGILRDLK